MVVFLLTETTNLYYLKLLSHSKYGFFYDFKALEKLEHVLKQNE